MLSKPVGLRFSCSNVSEINAVSNCCLKVLPSFVFSRPKKIDYELLL